MFYIRPSIFNILQTLGVYFMSLYKQIFKTENFKCALEEYLCSKKSEKKVQWVDLPKINIPSKNLSKNKTKFVH